MSFIATIEELEEYYGTPAPSTLRKVTSRLTTEYRDWISRSRFCILTTVGPEGTDGSPRGDDGPVVTIWDDQTLAMPDWHGNNRIDSLRNIVRDGRVSLMFMIAGANNVIRINGKARLPADPQVLAQFERKGRQPRTVMVITIHEVYIQCARALMRSHLWTDGDQSAGLPTPGQIVAAITDGALGGESYDQHWPARAAKTMW